MFYRQKALQYEIPRAFHAEEGLRTLYIAKREIDDETYTEWNAKSEQAKLATRNREEEVAAVDE